VNGIEAIHRDTLGAEGLGISAVCRYRPGGRYH
jgi:hypothetical protein